eukprot:m.245613 g.245613  ORF g.245613 m.245613 type:complete len:132 (+) comp33837_c5_seq5:189-584(+)
MSLTVNKASSSSWSLQACCMAEYQVSMYMHARTCNVYKTNPNPNERETLGVDCYVQQFMGRACKYCVDVVLHNQPMNFVPHRHVRRISGYSVNHIVDPSKLLPRQRTQHTIISYLRFQLSAQTNCTCAETK